MWLGAPTLILLAYITKLLVLSIAWNLAASSSINDLENSFSSLVCIIKYEKKGMWDVVRKFLRYYFVSYAVFSQGPSMNYVDSQLCMYLWMRVGGGRYDIQFVVFIGGIINACFTCNSMLYWKKAIFVYLFVSKNPN